MRYRGIQTYSGCWKIGAKVLIGQVCSRLDSCCLLVLIRVTDIVCVSERPKPPLSKYLFPASRIRQIMTCVVALYLHRYGRIPVR
jgi:hypothetical protein